VGAIFKPQCIVTLIETTFIYFEKYRQMVGFRIVGITVW